ncbi:MAG: hypothetical protein ACYTBR_08750, partial [Planctomycetota bacterium]
LHGLRHRGRCPLPDLQDLLSRQHRGQYADRKSTNPDQLVLCVQEPDVRETQEEADRPLFLGSLDTIISIARNTPDSDICRSLIDLDRCLFLKENGYDVMYREELFFAHQAGNTTGPGPQTAMTPAARQTPS